VGVLVIDLGTTTIRASIVSDDGSVEHTRSRRLPPSRPSPGVAEFDASLMADCVVELASDLLNSQEAVEAVGIATQRASTVLFDASTGRVLGPGLGWQDQRTVGQCIALQSQGIRLSPNQSATKLALLLDQFGRNYDGALRFATLDTWIAWRLSEGGCHVTDATNAAITGLVDNDATGWDLARCEILHIGESLLPSIVNSAGVMGEASALRGAPPIAALIGDQQASLIGQGCLNPGMAKVTFGSGGMLDVCVGETRPEFATRGAQGTFPIVTRQLDGVRSWGIEAILLSAGSCVDWLRDGLGIIGSAIETDALAASVRDSAGVSFVPAFGGLGTPLWDFGARGTLVGLDGATGKAEIVRAVLEGIANAGADLLMAVESDSGLSVTELRVDGGMAANATFLQLLANATQRPIAKSSLLEATTRGAGVLAGLGIGRFHALEETADLVAPAEIIQPRRRGDRERWLDARDRSLKVVPLLSALEF
jgi:glycerol kinase